MGYMGTVRFGNDGSSLILDVGMVVKDPVVTCLEIGEGGARCIRDNYKDVDFSTVTT